MSLAVGIGSGNRKGMEPKLYNGALSGSVEVLYQFNWTERRTLVENNVLHVHMGKPLQASKSKVMKGTAIVSAGFIQAILNHEDGYSLLWKQNANGDTPLHLAARFRQKEAVEVSLGRVKLGNQDDARRLLRIKNKKNDTVLHEAARVGQVGMVKLILEAGDPNDSLQHHPNGFGETPFYLAAESGCDQTLATLLHGCCTSTLGLFLKGPCGRTALHAAIQHNNQAMVQQMMQLEVDGSVILAQDDQGQTPLHLAALCSSRLKLLKVLLEYDNENESAVYIQDKEGRTALHVATLQCNWDGLLVLSTLCPDSIEIVDNKGQNVVHYAASLGCLSKLKIALNLGCFDKLVSDSDVNGNTPLHLLAASEPGLPPHYCFRKLRHFVRGSLMEVAAFNHNNLAPGDVYASNTNLREHYFPDATLLQVGPVGRRLWTYRMHCLPREERIDQQDEEVIAIKSRAANHLVVATLIATVSFTAGFTPPGGFNQNPGENVGMALLTRQASFKAFLISDAMAFTFSGLAVICYVLLTTKTTLLLVDLLYRLGRVLIALSLGTLMIAFVTGVCAVVIESVWLAVGIFVISAFFFLPHLFLLRGSYHHSLYYYNLCRWWYN